MGIQSEFRNFLFPLEGDRLAPFRGMDARRFGEAVHEFPFPATLINGWKERRDQSFYGITCDGHCVPGLYPLADENAPQPAMIEAARDLLDRLDEGSRHQLRYPIDAQEWRHWSNPEFLVNDNGLRLEDCDPAIRGAILRLVETSLSRAGFEKARGCMKTNAFLGELCNLPLIMNEWSYNFLLFGEPSATQPWGWNFYGHHLALNCFVLGGQIVISPTFMGAEPNVIDIGPDAGLRLFDAEEKVGLALMQSLSAEQRGRATVYQQLHDPAMPEGRWHPADQRHLGGAFWDNRIIRNEGVPVSEFGAHQKRQLMDIVEAFISYLPDQPRSAKLSGVEERLDHTWWSWIGSHGDEDPFYYRIQGPVLMTEFDHHSGVWLNNQQPAKCHIHTVVRTPNGNDYGKDLLRQHYERIHPQSIPGQD